MSNITIFSNANIRFNLHTEFLQQEEYIGIRLSSKKMCTAKRHKSMTNKIQKHIKSLSRLLHRKNG